MLPNSILFVCLGNICRSPSAHAIAKQLLPTHTIDSAATGSHTQGLSADSRAVAVGAKLGYDLTDLRARPVQMEDFYRFEVIYAMDNQNLADLQTLQQNAQASGGDKALAKLELFDPAGVEVDDPYYGDEAQFEAMFAHLQRIFEARFGCSLS